MAEDTLKVELVCRDFNRMLEQLAAIDTTIEFRDVVIASAARVMFSAMNKTRAATLQSIRRSMEEKEFITFGGKKYKMSHRYPDPLWARIEEFEQARFEIKYASRGLAKGSWNWLGKALGFDGKSVPSYVSSANYRGRVYPEDAQTFEAGNASGFALTILNLSPVVQPAGGKYALLRAMQGETQYFEISMERRAFATLDDRVRRYPQIFAQKTTFR